MCIFVAPLRLRFSDTDFAGIIFYARYFELLNGVVDDWFEEVAGVSFGDLIGKHGAGCPLGEVHTRFNSPCRLGDHLQFRLRVERVTRQTITFLVETYRGDSLMIRTRATHVCAANVSGAANWPDPVEKKIAAFQSRE